MKKNAVQLFKTIKYQMNVKRFECHSVHPFEESDVKRNKTISWKQIFTNVSKLKQTFAVEIVC